MSAETLQTMLRTIEEECHFTGGLTGRYTLRQQIFDAMATVRREDVVARVAQAEFAVLVPQADRAQALVLCERLRERITAEALTIVGSPVAVSASIGLVTLSADAPETFDQFLVLVE